ncbi:MAG: periplasmic heavy metal sensor [Proteobacteria bacterium]|nr:periplasmic heavy metal sensor [Pseudomonadota bacterium]
MKKSMIVITSFLAVALLATSAFSWGPGKGCGGAGQGYGTGESSAWNDLSKQQKDELTALNQKFIDETYEVRSAMMTKHQEMRLLMETSSPDRAKLEALSKAVTDLQGQMQTKRIDYQLAAKKIAPELSMGGRGGCGGCGPNGGSGNCPRQDRGYNQ